MASIRVRTLARALLGPVCWNQLKLTLGSGDRNAFYDALTEEILRRHLRDDSVCVDVGCHSGVILRYASPPRGSSMLSSLSRICITVWSRPSAAKT